MKKELATIQSAKLEILDRGFLNFWIMVDYENGSSQGIGGIALDEYDKDIEKRIGTAYGCEMIRQLLLTLNVNDFSEMKGLNILVLGSGEGLSFKPLGVQSLRSNGGKKVIFSDIFERFSNEKTR